MRLSLKLAVLTAMLGTVCTNSAFADNTSCPKISKKELETLCNWSIIETLHLGKAGQIKTDDGITLMNETKSCGGLDSVRSFISSEKGKTYQGTLSNHPRDPKSNVLKLCTYKIHTFNKDVVIGFGVLYPKPVVTTAPVQEEKPAQPAKKAKTLMGVDIYGGGPQAKEFEIKKQPPKVPPRPQAALPEPTLDELKRNPPREAMPMPDQRYQPSITPPDRKPPPTAGKRPLPQIPTGSD
jgi:hypothetical protein